MSKQRWLLTAVLILTACTQNIAPDATDAGTDPSALSRNTGQFVPHTPPVSPMPTSTLLANVSPNAVPTKTTTPPATTASPMTTVTVTTGDTLLGLALSHSVPMAAIQIQNDLGSSTTIQLGQQLTIPPAEAWKNASPYWIVHIVSGGETLGEISQAYGLTIADVQSANTLAGAGQLTTGQPLIMPLTNLIDPNTVIAALTSAAPAVEATLSTPDVDESAIAALSATPVTPTATQTPLEAGPPAIADWPYETVRIMNEVRAQNGLPPLAYNETLARAAQIQADDCANRGSCSHTGSDGSTIKDRVLSVGYQPASWAECWAIRPTPQEAIDIWMDEIPPNDPHRSTLLTTWFTEIGVGVAEAAWGYYFIADFGKPLQP